MTNKEIIKRIDKWQKCKYLHPLTCGTDSNHKILKAIEKNKKVILFCEDCDYKQENIPLCVIDVGIDKHNKHMDKLFMEK